MLKQADFSINLSTLPPAVSIPGTPRYQLRHFGLVDYESTVEKMRHFTLSRTKDSCDELWLLQHRPVFTQGQAGKDSHVLNAHDIAVVKSDRGGQVTYHGPGQLVIYLLIDVKRNKFGVRDLVDVIEKSIISMLQRYGIGAQTKIGAPGVYVGDAKIAALGLRIKKGCSYHGLSLNIDMDLSPFSYINPCGYEGLACTQVISHLAQPVENVFSHVQDCLVAELLGNLQYNG